ncbi:MAG TPA: hypothetical protein VNW49_01020 [Puia sp.]|jgi:hypothetical protein|nr:hypothetical protein [Puia sp.]
MIESAPDIRYLHRNEIDTEKWDRCIINAPNGLIYARSFYLDSMAENWSALVEGDFQNVMPLTWNKKYGFSYLYQPFFTKALGVFGQSLVPFEISSFLLAIPKKYTYWDFDLNENNFVSIENKKLKINQYPRTNHFLSLKEDYGRLRQQYKRLASRMKKKAIENQLQITRGEDPSLIISLYRKDYARRHHSIKNVVYEKLMRCSAIAFKNNLAETYLAKSVSGEIMAYYIILQDEKFVYSLLGGSTEEGKKLGAFYLLTDAIIQDHAGTKRIFRFEGSDIPGISFFDALFGSEKISYQHLVMNNLPFPFRLFK